MYVPHLKAFGSTAGDALITSVRGLDDRRSRRLRQCGRNLQNLALAVRDGDDSFCDGSMAMGFRAAFSALSEYAARKYDPTRYTSDLRRMMGEMIPNGAMLAEGLVLRPLHTSMSYMSGIVHGCKDTILITARERILRQLERGTQPSSQTLERWMKLGARIANRLTSRAIEMEYLKSVAPDGEVKFQTQGMMSECFRVAVLIADLRRAQLIFDPRSAKELWEEQ